MGKASPGQSPDPPSPSTQIRLRPGSHLVIQDRQLADGHCFQQIGDGVGHEDPAPTHLRRPPRTAVLPPKTERARIGNRNRMQAGVPRALSSPTSASNSRGRQAKSLHWTDRLSAPAREPRDRGTPCGDPRPPQDGDKGGRSSPWVDASPARTDGTATSSSRDAEVRLQGELPQRKTPAGLVGQRG